MLLFSSEKICFMPELYIYECECVECGHKWTSHPMEKAPFTCPECESNDVEVLNQVQQSSE